jgi:molybdate transport system regulatory protein
MQLRSLHWIVDENNQIIIGKGRMEILELIDQTGSINQAAKRMKMSYKGVWSKIKSTEKHLKMSVVHSDKKTGTHLTREGKTLLDQYRQMRKACCRADDDIFDHAFKPK